MDSFISSYINGISVNGNDIFRKIYSKIYTYFCCLYCLCIFILEQEEKNLVVH